MGLAFNLFPACHVKNDRIDEEAYNPYDTNEPVQQSGLSKDTFLFPDSFRRERQLPE